ncbi:MAG: CHAP domain-containing protein [Hyphomonadaceae bacterium]
MTSRAIFFAATAIAAGFAAGEADALTPYSIDPTGEWFAEPEDASPYALAPPGAFQPAQPQDSTFRPSLASSGPRLQCVPFARRESGVEIYGDAETWWRQARTRFETTDAPDEGAVMVMRGYRNPNRGHVAVVREIINDRLVLIDHANWLNRGEITRRVPVRDVSPRGDWSQIQVWHIPGQHWGGRVYNVQGFIVPNSERRPEADAALAHAAGANAPIG